MTEETFVDRYVVFDEQGEEVGYARSAEAAAAEAARLRRHWGGRFPFRLTRMYYVQHESLGPRDPISLVTPSGVVTINTWEIVETTHRERSFESSRDHEGTHKKLAADCVDVTLRDGRRLCVLDVVDPHGAEPQPPPNAPEP